MIPTIPQTPAGQTIDPLVSVPMERGARLAETETADPELDPHGLRLRSYGLRHCPPRPLQPLEDRVERKFAHSLRFPLASSTAPASRSREATWESRTATEPSRAREPAVVVIRSALSILSLSTTGMPCSGPRTCPSRRSSSSRSASLRASGFTSIMALSAGPLRSNSWIRFRYICVIECELSRPDLMASCSRVTVVSSSSNPIWLLRADGLWMDRQWFKKVAVPAPATARFRKRRRLHLRLPSLFIFQGLRPASGVESWPRCRAG